MVGEFQAGDGGAELGELLGGSLFLTDNLGKLHYLLAALLRVEFAGWFANEERLLVDDEVVIATLLIFEDRDIAFEKVAQRFDTRVHGQDDGRQFFPDLPIYEELTQCVERRTDTILDRRSDGGSRSRRG